MKTITRPRPGVPVTVASCTLSDENGEPLWVLPLESLVYLIPGDELTVTANVTLPGKTGKKRKWFSR